MLARYSILSNSNAVPSLGWPVLSISLYFCEVTAYTVLIVQNIEFYNRVQYINNKSNLAPSNYEKETIRIWEMCILIRLNRITHHLKHFIIEFYQYRVTTCTWWHNESCILTSWWATSYVKDIIKYTLSNLITLYICTYIISNESRIHRKLRWFFCCFSSSGEYFAHVGTSTLDSWNTVDNDQVWNAVTVLCGQLDCDDGHL